MQSIAYLGGLLIKRMNTSSSDSNQSVLIVEDDIDVRRFLSYALKHLGFRVSECSDVSAAERFLDSTSPDFVLADRNLPKESGTDLVRRSHQFHSMIGMSGQRECSSEMLDAGALDFLPKPIALDDLKNVIEKHREAVKAHKAKQQAAAASAEAKTRPLQQNGTRAHLTNAPRDWMRAWNKEQRRLRSRS